MKHNVINLLNRSKEELTEIRKEKLRTEIESATRILQSGIEPLEVADSFFHDTLHILEEGLRNRNPGLSDKEVTQKIEDSLNFIKKIKSKRPRRRNV